MKKTTKLNFYNYLKVEYSSSIKLRYFKKFQTNDFTGEINVSLKITEVNLIDKKNHILVSNYLSYDPVKKEIFLIDKNGKYAKSIFGMMSFDSINLQVEKGFSAGDIISFIIKPILRRVLINNNCALIHASSYSINDKATLIAAWAHTGKTSTLLSNIVNGAEYLGDDLSVITSNGTIKPFPSPINIFYYNIKDIDEIRSKISLRAKIKFFITQRLAKIFDTLNKISKKPNIKYLFHAGKLFFNSASHFSYEIDTDYSLDDENSEKLAIKNILLERENSNESIINSKPISPKLFADRMQNCINYEFQRFNEISTSAKWVPFYNGDDLFFNEELIIYRKFANIITPVNVLIPKKMDFSNDEYYKIVQEILDETKK